MALSRTITESELTQHKDPENAWVVIDGKVLDVSGFRFAHPGGEKVCFFSSNLADRRASHRHPHRR